MLHGRIEFGFQVWVMTEDRAQSIQRATFDLARGGSGRKFFENVHPAGEFSCILALKTCRTKLKFHEHFTL
jgi:hypothetical protein